MASILKRNKQRSLQRKKGIKGPSNANEYGTPAYWQAALKGSIDMREQHSRIGQWGHIEDMYNHKYDGTDPVFNIVYSFGRALVPALVYHNPIIVNTARFPQFIPFAAILDSIDEWLMQEMDFEDVMKESVLYSYLYNMAPVEVGWDFPDPGAGKEAGERGSFLSNMGVLDAVGDGTVNRARKQNFPWVDLIHPRKILFDPTTTNMRTCRWYAKSLYVPTRILEKDKSLKNGTARSSHIPNELIDDQSRMIFEQVAGYEPYTHFYEVHNAEDGTMHWQNSYGEFMFAPIPDPMGMDGLPLEALVFNRNPLSIWGTPDVSYIEPQMHFGNEQRRLQLKHIRASLLKWVADSDAIEPEELEKIWTDDVAMIRAKSLSPSGDLRGKIVPLQASPRLDMRLDMQGTLDDAQKVMGLGNNQMGQMNSGRRTKSEVQTVQGNSDIRMSERRNMIGKVIGNIFRKINQGLFSYWDTPMTVRVMGADAAQHWVTTKPSDIKSEMELKVDVDTLVPPSREQQKEDMLGLLRILSSVEGANLIPIIRKFVSLYPSVDANQILPTKNTQDQPQSAQEFADSQNKLLNDGGTTRESAARNLGKLME